MSPGLVALGSAAVVAVYAAGFYKTKVAADAFAEPDRSGGGPANLPPGMRPAGTGDTRPTPPADGMPAPSTERPSVTLSLPTSSPVQAKARSAQPVESQPAPMPTAPVVLARSADPAPSAAAEVPPPAETAAAVPVATGASAVSTAPGTPSASSAADANATASAQASQTPLPPTPSKLKDGTFLGWGRCRHGDIEAKVEITGGKIVSAEITQCLTRWSCSWISPLPPQVLTRQSENVDYVSGATQSAIAFYWAIFDALSKAK